jgi:AAA15 family ATPase/GTPase
MELKYIWVESFNSLQNFGVNLSHNGKHQFIYDNSSLKLLPNILPLLDFGSAVSSITAIAGQNGSGKSSLCEVMLRAMATLTDGSLGYNSFEGIVCFDDYIFYHEKFRISNQKVLIKKGYKVIKFKESPLESYLSDPHSDLRLLGFMYYSNVIDWRSNINEHNLSNISTQHHIHQDVFYGPHFSFQHQDGSINDDTYRKEMTNLMTGYYFEESFRHVNFYVNFPGLIPFDHPEQLIITLGYSGNNKWIHTRNELVYTDPFENYERTIFENVHYNFYADMQKDNVDLDIDLSLIRTAARWLYRHNLAISHMNETKKNTTHLREFVFEEKWVPEIFGDKDTIARQLVSAMDELISRGTFKSTYNPYSLSRWSTGDWRADIINRIRVKNSESNRQLIKRVITLENALLNYEFRSIKRLSDYDLWPSPSAGSYSFLSLFSRIYQAVKWNQLGYYDRKWFMLFVDEGEINFHPAWKQKLVKWLIDFLNLPFHDYKFQIVFTTHSPYLLSDLTNNNVVLIKRTGNTTEIVPVDMYRTFATNIHELLAMSFFMENGFIGEFAQRTIESLIDYLENDQRKSGWSLKKALALINTVGDEIIKQRLIDLYEEKFGPTERSLQEELSKLEIRINEIRKRLK